MSDYDFNMLNDKEFETLCTDLLGAESGVNFERFKAGKDGGIDGRYFSPSGSRTFVQCKHWLNTPFPQFLKHLRGEAKKAEKLKPDHYILTVSYPLSAHQKKQIANIFLGLINNESDILGREDLNHLLSKHPDVERRCYKLWLTTSSVLQNLIHSDTKTRSDFSLEEILDEIHLYVYTSNHSTALAKLESKHVAIITGEPGVGKTTLANHLCLGYIEAGYKYFYITSIEEAEKSYLEGQPQIFYFDDFLGANYLEAISGHEGSKISRFIRMISKKKDKRFILTSRTGILNKGKELFEIFHHENIQKNEFEVTISSLTNRDKAFILYNQIFHGGLNQEYIDEIYKDKRYRDIVSHRNFNPRLIRFITDPSRLESIDPNKYWAHIKQALSNPSAVWDMPFKNQADDYGRALVKLVVFNGRQMDELELNNSYLRYLKLPHNPILRGEPDFMASVRLMTGALINRTIDADSGKATIDTFNPSIGDYVLNKFAKDTKSVADAIFCLRSLSSLRSLESLSRNNFIEPHELIDICESLLDDMATALHRDITPQFTAKLCAIYEEACSLERNVCNSYTQSLKFAMNIGADRATDTFFFIIERAVRRELVSTDDAAIFLKNQIDGVSDLEEIKSFNVLLESLGEVVEKDVLKESLDSRIIELAGDDFDGFFAPTDAFWHVPPGEYDRAREVLLSHMESTLSSLGVYLNDPSTLNDLLDSYSYSDALDKYYEDGFDSDSGEYNQSHEPSSNPFHDVDDIFERN